MQEQRSIARRPTDGWRVPVPTRHSRGRHVSADATPFGSVATPCDDAHRLRTVIPGPARTLELLALAHAGIGVVLHRRALVSMARAGLVSSVDDHGPRATAWWFLAAAPLLWTTGRLLRSAPGSRDVTARRDVGLAITATGAAGVVVMPRSPFWILTATGLRIVAEHRSTRPATRRTCGDACQGG